MTRKRYYWTQKPEISFLKLRSWILKYSFLSLIIDTTSIPLFHYFDRLDRQSVHRTNPISIWYYIQVNDNRYRIFRPEFLDRMTLNGAASFLSNFFGKNADFHFRHGNICFIFDIYAHGLALSIVRCIISICISALEFFKRFYYTSVLVTSPFLTLPKIIWTEILWKTCNRPILRNHLP